MYPASHQQTELWPEVFSARGEQNAWNLLWAVTIEGPADSSRIAAALAEVLLRYPSLRSRFEYRDGRLWVEEGPLEGPELPCEDMSALPEAVVQQRFEAFGARPYDPSTGRVARFLLVRLAGGRAVLLCGFHHLVMDGWSWTVFLEDLTSILRGDPLPPVRLSYASYCEDQAAAVQAGLGDADLAYWRGIASGMSPRSALPGNAPGAPQDEARGATVRSTLGAAQSEAVARCAQRLGTTPFRLCFAAFAAWLARLTGDDGQRIATILTGRSQPAETALFGFCNTYGIVDAETGGGTPFRQLVASVSDEISNAIRHQHLPAGYTLKAAGFREVAHDVARCRPSFVKIPRQRRLAAGNLTLSDRRIVLPSIAHELSVDWQQERDGIALTWTYPSGRLLRTSVEDFAQQYGHVLTQFVDNPDLTVEEVVLLSPAQQAAILNQGCGPERSFPVDVPITDQIREQAKRTPDRIAVVDGTLRLDYAHIDAVSDRLAQRLAVLGARRGTFVPLVMASSAAQLIAEIAVMKTGAAFVPVDPDWPAARRQAIMARLAPPVAIVHEEPSRGELAPVCQVIAVDAAGNPEGPAEPSGDGPMALTPVGGEDTIYCIFTSGSTGEPKGALNAHRGLVNRICTMTEMHGAYGPPVVLAGAPATVDTHFWQYHWPLLLGGRSVILRREQALSAKAIAELCASEQATLMDFVPWVFRNFTDRLTEQPGLASKLRSVKCVVIGGDKMDAEAVRVFKSHFPDIMIMNSYGPTEASIASVFRKVDVHSADAMTIGRPIANTSVAVLDGRLRLMPYDAVGEICLGGIAVGQGYLGRPEETAKRFVRSPYPTLGPRLYRTGDRGRLRRDGSLEILGRIDDQISLAGNRIEPGEVEVSLNSHPDVAESAVTLSPAGAGPQALVAYVVAEAGAQLSARDLRKYLLLRLPRQMVPSEYRQMEAIPHSTAGKLDRALLGSGLHGRRLEDHKVSDVRVEGATGAIIAAWQEVLGRSDVGPHDDFFGDLGGDSLLALECELLCEERSGRAPDLHRFFTHSTPSDLARAISQAETAPPAQGAAGFEAILARQRAFTSTWDGRRNSPDSLLFTKNPDAPGRALFWCFQGSHELNALAAALGPDHPVTGMRSGHMIMDYTAANVSALARLYADEIASLSLSDGVVLGGNCQGAEIIHAVAMALRSVGQEVDMMLHIDDTSFKSYPGPITLIYGSESHLNPFRDGDGPEAFFRENYPGGASTVFVPGAHGTYFRGPGLAALAKIVKQALARPQPLAAG